MLVDTCVWRDVAKDPRQVACAARPLVAAPHNVRISRRGHSIYHQPIFFRPKAEEPPMAAPTSAEGIGGVGWAKEPPALMPVAGGGPPHPRPALGRGPHPPRHPR